jgi:hypothetical protein
MGFDGNTKIGRLLSVPAARVVLLRHIEELQDGGANVNLVKGMSLQTLAGYIDGDWLEPLLADLAEVPEPSADDGETAARAAVVEDAPAGVEAARRGGFRLVIGVDRVGQADALRSSGADVVVRDLAEVIVR